MGDTVLVVGLGRFGTAAALELMALGHEVLAVDNDVTLVNRIASEVTHAVEVDASDEAALRSLGAGDFEHAIVAISSHIETSIFATMALKRLGVPNVVAKAANELHGAILERVGAGRVVYPEREMGERVSHVLSVPYAIDYLDVAPRFGIVKVAAPAAYVGKSLAEIDFQGRFKLTPISVRRGDRVTVIPALEERVAVGDEIILLGRDDRLEALGT